MLDNEKRYISEDNLKAYTRVLSNKNQVQTLLLQNDINANTQRIAEATANIEAEHTAIRASIQDIQTLLEQKDELLSQKIDNAAATLNSNIQNTKSQLTDDLSDEISDRRSEIARLELDYTGRLEAQDKSHRQDLGNQIDTIAGAVRTEFQNADQLLVDRISAESNERQKFQSNQNSVNLSINERITAEIKQVNQSITDHNSQYTDLNTLVSEHTSSKKNPHEITVDQIGAASRTEHVAVEKRVKQLENDTSTYAETMQGITQRQEEINQNLSTLREDADSLLVDKLNVNGSNQVLTGDLTIAKDGVSASGNLTVQGNLEVRGTTTIVDQETVTVKDNFIVINSDNSELGTSLSGIVIRTGTDEYGSDSSYGIAYDKSTDSISLGRGHYTEGDFYFEVGESKPVLTRDHSNNISNGHVLVWDSNKNMAVDGGVYSLESLEDNFVKRTEHDSVVREVTNIQSDISSLYETDNYVSTELEQLSTTLTEQAERTSLAETDIFNLKMSKQPINDNSLRTTAKHIVGAINEVSTTVDNHKIDYENPHNVTWSQINPAALTNVNPKMSGTASPGVQSTVSRSDHVHPSDTSRAPVNHANASDIYGQASATMYGHVLVDEYMSNVRTNPVQNKVIKEYVDSSIDNIKTTVTVSTGETISKITQAKGVINVESEPVQIEISQVTDLQNQFTRVDADIQQLTETFNSNTETLQERLQSIQGSVEEEATRAKAAEQGLTTAVENERTDRLNGDTALATTITNTTSDLTAMINSDRDRIGVLERANVTYSDLQSSIDKIIQDIESGEHSHEGKWVLSFGVTSAGGVTTYHPYFRALDDGELPD